MFLSRLTLNPRSEEAARDLANPYQLHKTLSGVYGPAPEGRHRATHGVLFRVEDARSGPAVLVQSTTAPDWGSLPAGYAVRVDGPKPLSLGLAEGQRLRFRLVANPVRRTRHTRADGKSVVRRWPLVHPKATTTEAGASGPDGYLDWLARQAAAAGFAVEAVAASPFRVHGRRPLGDDIAKDRVPHFGVRFDGELRVTDTERLQRAVQHGIGPAKAFGFGLLSLAPA